MNSNTMVVKEEKFPNDPSEGDTYRSGQSGITYVYRDGEWRPA
jgi:hypothetical protein